MSNLVSVTFSQSYGAYNAGDVAGFVPTEAARLTNTPISGPGGPEIMLARMSTPEDIEAYSARIGGSSRPAAAEEIVSLQITGSVDRYNRGDIAGFPKSVADRLVNIDKVAIYNPQAEEMKAEADAKAKAAKAEEVATRLGFTSARDENLKGLVREAVAEALADEKAGARGKKSPVRGEKRPGVTK